MYNYNQTNCYIIFPLISNNENKCNNNSIDDLQTHNNIDSIQKELSKKMHRVGPQVFSIKGPVIISASTYHFFCL